MSIEGEDDSPDLGISWEPTPTTGPRDVGTTRRMEPVEGELPEGLGLDLDGITHRMAAVDEELPPEIELTTGQIGPGALATVEATEGTEELLRIQNALETCPVFAGFRPSGLRAIA